MTNRQTALRRARKSHFRPEHGVRGTACLLYVWETTRAKPVNSCNACGTYRQCKTVRVTSLTSPSSIPRTSPKTRRSDCRQFVKVRASSTAFLDIRTDKSVLSVRTYKRDRIVQMSTPHEQSWHGFAVYRYRLKNTFLFFVCTNHDYLNGFSKYFSITFGISIIRLTSAIELRLVYNAFKCTTAYHFETFSYASVVRLDFVYFCMLTYCYDIIFYLWRVLFDALIYIVTFHRYHEV